jgi:hypothetical protein
MENVEIMWEWFSQFLFFPVTFSSHLTFTNFPHSNSFFLLQISPQFLFSFDCFKQRLEISLSK